MAPKDEFAALCAELSSDVAAAAAGGANVLWGRIPSYPMWPAQVLSEEAVAARPALGAAKRRKDQTTAVVFFGDLTLGWLSEAEVVAWGEGMARGLHLKSKTGKFRDALRQVGAFLHPQRAHAAAPAGWWCAPAAAADAPRAASVRRTPAKRGPDDSGAAPSPAAVTSPAAKRARAERKPAADAAPAPAAAPAAAVVPRLLGSASARPAPTKFTSRRDVMRPLVSRLKATFPSLRRVTHPDTAEGLQDVIEAFFGAVLRLDEGLDLRNNPWQVLMAEVFSWALGRRVSWEAVQACYPERGAAAASALFSVDMDAINRLGIYPSHWKLPAVLGEVQAAQAAAASGAPPPEIIYLQGPAQRPAAAAAASPAGKAAKAAPKPAAAAKPQWRSAAVAAAAAADAAAASSSTDAGGNAVLAAFTVVNGRLVRPRGSRPNSVLGQSGEGSSPGLEGQEEGDDAAPAAPLLAALPSGVPGPPGSAAANKNLRPAYSHVKQNVWVCKQRPKRLPKDEIQVCSCCQAGAPGDNTAAHRAMAQLRQGGSTSRRSGAAAAALVEAEAEASSLAAPACAAASESPLLTEGERLVRALVSAAFAAAVAAAEPAAAPQAPPRLPRGRLASAGVAAAVAAASGRMSRLGPGSAAAAAPPQEVEPTGGSASAAAAGGAGAERAEREEVPRDGCDEGCLNRISYIHCDPRTCPCGERCSNRPFHALPSPPMEVFLTSEKGWGVRATGAILRGTFVVEYAGEIIDDAEMAARAEDAKRRNEPHFYMMEMAPGMIIDARVKGNVARLLNSSCDPNCETQKWHDASNGEIRVGIFALRDIAPGEELTYDYQFQHFGLAAAAGAYKCMCGAANCRGTMDTHPERTKDYGRRLDIWWSAERRFYRGTVTGYSAAQQRHSLLYDDGETTRLCLAGVRHRWVSDREAAGAVVEEEQQPAARRAAAAASKGKKRSTAAAAAVAAPAPPAATKRQRQPEAAAAPAAASEAVKAGEQGSSPPAAAEAGKAAADEGGSAPATAQGLVQGPAAPSAAAPGSLALGGLPPALPSSPLLPLSLVMATQSLTESQAVLPATVAVPLAHSGLASPALPSSPLPPPPKVEMAVEGEEEDAGPALAFSPPAQTARRLPASPLPTAEELARALRTTSPPGPSQCHLAEDRELRQRHLAALAPAAGGAAAVAGALPWVGALPYGEAITAAAAALAPAIPQLDGPSDVPPPRATVGRLHGSGRGSAGRPKRAARRPSRRYGDDYASGDDAAGAAGEEQAYSSGGDHGSPVRAPLSDPRSRSALAAMSPATQAAATIASLIGGGGSLPEGLSTRGTARQQPSPAALPAAPASGGRGGGGGRRAAPTPPSTGLPARTILVAKKLTNSDVSKGRILLPRAAVEANLSFAIGRAHSLAAKDHNGRGWTFTLQSWANGMESRRVYVLEHAGEYLRTHALRPEDVIGISTTEDGEFLVEYNTAEVCSAAETQQAARIGQGGPSPSAMPGAPSPAGGVMNPLVQANSGRCIRSEYCNKPAGHPGFCMRTPGAAGGARNRRASGGAAASRGGAAGGVGMAAATAPPAAAQRPPRPAAAPGRSVGGKEKRRGALDTTGRPQRYRRPSLKASEFGADSDEEEGESEDGEEESGDEEESEDDRGRSATPPPAQPEPVAVGPGVPPIFVMAPDMSMSPVVPPHLRSPLRPSMASQHHALAHAASVSDSLNRAASLSMQPSVSGPLPGPPPGLLPPAGPPMYRAGMDAATAAAANTPALQGGMGMAMHAQHALGPAPGAAHNHQHHHPGAAVNVSDFLASSPEDEAEKRRLQQLQQPAAAQQAPTPSQHAPHPPQQPGQRPQLQQHHPGGAAAGAAPGQSPAHHLSAPAALSLPHPVVAPTLPAVPGMAGAAGHALGGPMPSASFMPPVHHPLLPAAPPTVPLFGAAPPAVSPTCATAPPPAGSHATPGAHPHAHGGHGEPDFDVMEWLG